MTPDEQRMIQDLFQRLASQGRVAKDVPADRLISDAMRANPDAGYLLVQTTLVYEQQIAEQDGRLRDLEDQIAQLQQAAVAPAAGGGSFLGGRVGAGRGSVPPVAPVQPSSPWGAPQQPTGYAQPAQQRGGMFGGGAPAPTMGMGAPQAPGFFRSALQTAAGVAGGMMVANSLGGLFGGGHEAHAAQSALGSDQSAALHDADATQDDLQDQLADQDAADDAATDAGGWDDIET